MTADCVGYFTIDPVHPEARCADILSAAGGSSTHSQQDQGNKFKSLKGNVRLQHKACKVLWSTLLFFSLSIDKTGSASPASFRKKLKNSIPDIKY